MTTSLKPQNGESLFDLIIIGGGINGTGIAREATERGLQVLLVEKHDLGTGTTAGSTRLIHGGLRYLETYEFSLVRESLKERERLLKNAAHLVEPLPLGIPFYPSGRPPWLIRMGMWLYDFLSWDKDLPKHRYLNAEQFKREFSGINPEGLLGGVIYYDAQLEFPERLCIENILAAHDTGNLRLLTHTHVTEILTSESSVIKQAMGIKCTDSLTQDTYMAHGRLIVNAAGPWVDYVNGTLSSAPRIGGTKGTHIVVRRFEGGPTQAIYAEARSNGRPYFIIPWQSDFYLIGTTDDPYPDNPDDALPLESEIDYLLAESNVLLPKAHLTRDKILYAYTGIRPLPYTDALTPGKITRRHFIVDHSHDPKTPVRNLYSLIGGKLTTYREFAQEVVDASMLQGTLKHADPDSKTANTPLPGGRDVVNRTQYKDQHMAVAAAKYNLSEPVIAQLIDLYGSQFSTVLDLADSNPDLKRIIVDDPPVLSVQVLYAIQNEFARTLGDIMRRLTLNWHASLGLDQLNAIANEAGRIWEWSLEERAEAIAEYHREIAPHQLAKSGIMPSGREQLDPATA